MFFFPSKFLVFLPAVLTQLTITSLPDALFQENSGIHNVVNNSVIQLFCTVESTGAKFSWTKDGSPVVINVPHLFERTCNDSTTTRSVLTINGFQSSDNGTYQCMATDGQQCGCGNTTTLTGMHGCVDIDEFTHAFVRAREVYYLIR